MKDYTAVWDLCSEGARFAWLEELHFVCVVFNCACREFTSKRFVDLPCFIQAAIREKIVLSS